jgi:hypothetical protein
MDGGLFELFDGSERQLLLLVALVPVAVFAIWYASRSFGRARSTASMRPQGRVLHEHPRKRTAAWRETVARLEEQDPTPVAEAKAGPVRVQGVLVAASGNLGGTPGRECVWRNRAGGRPDAAVGADLVVIADATGRCGIEGLEGAYVIAPAEKHALHHENVSLYLGDHVEVYATFEPEKTGEDPDPTQNVYGTLVPTAGLDIRLTKRESLPRPAEGTEPS